MEGISPRFTRNIRQYYVVIQDNVENIDVNAIPEDSKSNVQIIGNTNIQIGENRIVITVTAENGSAREYYINVTKTENIELANANLENLAIENASLIPEFSPDVTEYRVTIEEDVQNLNILAVPQIENAIVAITGNENLQPGENLISITVTAVNGTTSKVYNIVVVKGNVETETVDEDNEQDGNIEEPIENNQINIEKTNDEDKKKSNTKLLIAILIVLLIMGTIVIIFLKKLKKK